MARYGMALDLKRCLGCQACTVACKAENGTRPKVLWTLTVDQITGTTVENVQRLFTPMLCMHCKYPACKAACPVGAITKRADNIVLIDYDTCIGCRRCEWACPYGAPQFNGKAEGYFGAEGLAPYEDTVYTGHRVGAMEKCTFCVHRIYTGPTGTPGENWDATPACVNACIAGARIFGDLDDPDSEVSRVIADRDRPGEPLLPEMGTEPTNRYLPRH